MALGDLCDRVFQLPKGHDLQVENLEKLLVLIQLLEFRA